MLYFGSFNPIHRGHTAIAQWVVSQGLADRVWLVVSPQNPLKPSTELAPEYDRLAMARLAVATMPEVWVSDVEFALPRPSYTIDTVDYLKCRYPDIDFAILTGGDIACSIERWKEWGRLLAENNVYVYPRSGYNTLHTGMTLLDSAPVWDCSSTEIRSMAAAGESFSGMVAPEVSGYIKTHKLWKT